MTYRVLWSPHAEQGLEQMHQNAPERDLLAAAVREIDQYLVADPKTFG